MAEPTIDSAQLVELDALLRAESVAGAARTLGRSASALSAALTRLRTILEDRLLVRAGGGMKLTPRARALAGPVAEAVARLATVEERARDEEDAGGRAKRGRALRVAATDYVQLAAAAALARTMSGSRAEPGWQLSVLPIEQRSLLDKLARGRVDLALGLFDALDAGPEFRRKLLFRDWFVCVLRAGHPAARRWGLAQYAALGHVAVSPSGDVRARGVVDEALAQHGRARSVTVALPSLWAAGEIVAGSDCVLTVPERVGRAFAARGGVVLLAPPVTLPAISVFALWHERSPRAAEVKRVAAGLAGALGAGKKAK